MSAPNPPTVTEARNEVHALTRALDRLGPIVWTSPEAQAAYMEHVAVLADVLLYTDRPYLGEALAARVHVFHAPGVSNERLPLAVHEIERAFFEEKPLVARELRDGSVDPPRRVRVLYAGEDRKPFIKVGGYGLAEAWSLRGGNHCQDGVVSEPGELTYLVAKRTGGGALWYRARALRFVMSRKRTS